ncbi:hypothetical protein AB0E69_32110 [Kribbella sp. NPDC026611]|uniref:hypothetical protein n=1 Tax=Kribbella sp. NPDC026611 TaxID=3154911 RepID=UPI0033FE002D
MTDLKDLLDEAAGDPGVADQDPAADLARGRRAVRRRRFTAVGTSAVATALVVGVGWNLWPGGATQGQVAATPSPTPTPYRVVGGNTSDHRPGPVVPVHAVPLVPNTKAFPGKITCDLIPQGWIARVSYAGEWQQQELRDPKLDPKKYHDASTTLNVRASELYDVGNGLEPEKFGTPWAQLPKVRAGKNVAVTANAPQGDQAGRGEVFVRQGNSKRLVIVANAAYNLGWTMSTLLRFAGSCHYK